MTGESMGQHRIRRDIERQQRQHAPPEHERHRGLIRAANRRPDPPAPHGEQPRLTWRTP